MKVETGDQGTDVLKEKYKKFLPRLDELQIGTPYVKKLGELPAYLASQLAIIVSQTSCEIDTDGYGWSFPVTEDNEGFSLVIAIVTSDNKVCVYDRIDNDINKEQVTNIGADAIGSRGYMVNGLYNKIPKEYWDLKIKSAKFASEVAWENLSGNDKSKAIMPVLMIQLLDNDMPTLHINEIKNPVAKLQVVINELQETL